MLILNKAKRVSIESFTAFFITVIALCHSINLINKEISFVIAIMLIGVIVIKRLILKRGLIFYTRDIYWLLLLLLFLVHRDPGYANISTAFFILGWIAMFLLRDNPQNYKGVLVAILLFSFINLIVNIICIISPNAFIIIIRSLRVMNSDLYVAGTMTGLGSGIGRNAYFCVVGLTVTMSSIIVRSDKHKGFLWCFSAALLVILFSTGKLGHTLFGISSIVLVYLYTSRSLSIKIRNLLLLVFFGSLFFAISIEVFPFVGNIITRFAQKKVYGDLSSGRLFLWKRAINIFKEHPIFGIGYGAFSVNSLSLTKNAVYAGVHNDYLQWLCELGAVGFFINITILIKSYSLSMKELDLFINNKEKQDLYKQLIIVWSVFFQTFVILYSLSGIPHFSYEINTIYYLACGVPYALIRDSK
ncbi:hypothetical protein SANA_29060 [Gottschalkiaceae bacterium SANA]|nr:hypothetical protein SANA_29060 [Gottschalkiaceae bacterium SANA]